jgi:hypothetical protein
MRPPEAQRLFLAEPLALTAPNPVRQNRAYCRRIEFGSSHPDLCS